MNEVETAPTTSIIDSPSTTTISTPPASFEAVVRADFFAEILSDYLDVCDMANFHLLLTRHGVQVKWLKCPHVLTYLSKKNRLNMTIRLINNTINYDIFLGVIGKYFGNQITEVKIEANNQASDIGFERLLQKCTQLKRFELDNDSDNVDIVKSSVISYLGRYCKSLTHLKLSSLIISNKAGKPVLELVTACQSLETIELIDVVNFTDTDLSILGKYSSTLKHFELLDSSAKPKLSDKGMNIFLRGCNKLSTLKVETESKYVTEASLKSLSSLRSLRCLSLKLPIMSVNLLSDIGKLVLLKELQISSQVTIEGMCKLLITDEVINPSHNKSWEKVGLNFKVASLSNKEKVVKEMKDKLSSKCRSLDKYSYVKINPY